MSAGKPERRLTRARAIRLKCRDCCCGSAAEVRRCEIYDCALWTYRMGREVPPPGQVPGTPAFSGGSSAQRASSAAAEHALPDEAA